MCQDLQRRGPATPLNDVERFVGKEDGSGLPWSSVTDHTSGPGGRGRPGQYPPNDLFFPGSSPKSYSATDLGARTPSRIRSILVGLPRESTFSLVRIRKRGHLSQCQLLIQYTFKLDPKYTIERLFLSVRFLADLTDPSFGRRSTTRVRPSTTQWFVTPLSSEKG